MRRLFLLLYGLSGAAGLIYEVLWTRQLTLLMGHTTAAASTVLAAFMGGLAIGAALAGPIATRVSERRALQVYGLLELHRRRLCGARAGDHRRGPAASRDDLRRRRGGMVRRHASGGEPACGHTAGGGHGRHTAVCSALVFAQRRSRGCRSRRSLRGQHHRRGGWNRTGFICLHPGRRPSRHVVGRGDLECHRGAWSPGHFANRSWKSVRPRSRPASPPAGTRKSQRPSSKAPSSKARRASAAAIESTRHRRHHARRDRVRGAGERGGLDARPRARHRSDDVRVRVDAHHVHYRPWVGRVAGRSAQRPHPGRARVARLPRGGLWRCLGCRVVADQRVAGRDGRGDRGPVESVVSNRVLASGPGGGLAAAAGDDRPGRAVSDRGSARGADARGAGPGPGGPVRVEHRWARLPVRSPRVLR